jgi:anti-sigma-K factor RskA
MIQISIGLPGAGMSYYTTKRIEEMNNKLDQEKQEMIEDCNLVLKYIKINESRHHENVNDTLENVDNIIDSLNNNLSNFKAIKAFFEVQPENALLCELEPKIEQTIQMIIKGEIQ